MDIQVGRGECLAYLAIPYSHPDPAVKQKRFEIANKVTAVLMNRGLAVLSPISHSHPIAMQESLPGDWQFWERYDKIILSRCNLFLCVKIDGWEQSTGVQAEIKIAQALGLSSNFVDENGCILDEPVYPIKALVYEVPER